MDESIGFNLSHGGLKRHDDAALISKSLEPNMVSALHITRQPREQWCATVSVEKQGETDSVVGVEPGACVDLPPLPPLGLIRHCGSSPHAHDTPDSKLFHHSNRHLAKQSTRGESDERMFHMCLLVDSHPIGHVTTMKLTARRFSA